MIVSRMASGVGSEGMQEFLGVAAQRGVARLAASWIDLYDFLGYVGKGNFPFIRFFSCGLLVASLLLASACEGGDPASLLQSGRVVGFGSLEGRWVGPVSPETPGCGTTTIGLMNIGRGEFGFAPFQNTVVIRGKIGADNEVDGKLERVGGDKQVLTIRLTARATQRAGEPDKIDGALISGRCEWQAKLIRG